MSFLQWVAVRSKDDTIRPTRSVAKLHGLRSSVVINTRWNNKQQVSWLGYLQDADSGNRMKRLTGRLFHSTRTEPYQGVKDPNSQHCWNQPTRTSLILPSHTQDYYHPIKLHNTYWHITLFFSQEGCGRNKHIHFPSSICEADIEASNREMPASRHWKSRCQSLLVGFGEKHA